MDLGCYPIHWVRTLMDAQPEVESATSRLGPLGADEIIEARLTFGETVVDLRASMAPGCRSQHPSPRSASWAWSVSTTSYCRIWVTA
jgi:hypothetical protein